MPFTYVNAFYPLPIFKKVYGVYRSFINLIAGVFTFHESSVYNADL